MDAQSIRRALYDFFRFNPQDFTVSASGVGYMVSSVRRRQTPESYPYQLVSTFNGDSEAAIRVIPGTVDGISPILGTETLDSNPPPLLAPEAGTFIVALKITWTPATAEDAQDPPQAYLIGGGTLAEAEVVAVATADWPPTETPPTTTTDGIYYQRIGFYRAETSGGAIVILEVNNDTFRNSINCHFCPPDTFYTTRI